MHVSGGGAAINVNLVEHPARVELRNGVRGEIFGLSYRRAAVIVGDWIKPGAITLG